MPLKIDILSVVKTLTLQYFNVANELESKCVLQRFLHDLLWVVGTNIRACGASKLVLLANFYLCLKI